ncbi:MAG: sulfotransferase family protein [Chthoniobacterales bacterium]
MALRNPVIVAGFFRSGTSLLYALLNGHPRVAIMYECSVWEMPGALSGARFRRNWLERQEFYNKVLSRHRLTFGGSLRGLEELRTPEDLYRVYAQTQDADFWGEKSPLYGPRLKRLARRNPQTAFILVWRDPIEIYASVLSAGRTARFFRRNMLSRLILSNEEMVPQANELAKVGARIHHVTYDDLVDRSADVCHDLCKFLEIDFDAKMLDLQQADLTAIDFAPHHDHLRRGVIERQAVRESAIRPAVAAKLERFQKRWERLRGRSAGDKGASKGEPGLLERLYHRLVGRWLFFLDGSRRVLFEFLPLAWLRSYRQTKQWFLARRDHPAIAHSLGQQIRHHWVTLLICATALIFAANVDRLAGPWITLAPLYVVPVAVIALLINRIWGTGAAIVCALVWSSIKIPQSLSESSLAIFLWNTGMRFLLLQIIVVLIDRIRVEAAFDDPERN